MAAHGADARASATDIAAQEQEVENHLAGLDPLAVLRQTHAVDAHNGLRAHVDVRGAFEIRAFQAGLRLQRGPAIGFRGGREGLEAARVLGEEGLVERAASAGASCRLVGFEDGLAEAEDRGDVAAGAHLMVLRRYDGAPVLQKLERRLGIGEALEPALTKGIERDDLRPALPRLLQLVQHARRIRADVLAEEEDAVGMLEIVERDGAHGDADRLRKGDGGTLVAHVRTVGKIVGAVEPAEQPIHVGRLERGTPGGIEHHLFRVHRLQGRPDRRVGLAPFAGTIPVRGGIVAHRTGEASDLLEVVVRPGPEFAQRVPREEIVRHRLGRQLPGRGLGAILAIFERVRFAGLGPGATHAHEAVHLVLPHHQRAGRQKRMLARQDLGHRPEGSLATRRPVVGRQVHGAPVLRTPVILVLVFLALVFLALVLRARAIDIHVSSRFCGHKPANHRAVKRSP